MSNSNLILFFISGVHLTSIAYSSLKLCGQVWQLSKVLNLFVCGLHGIGVDLMEILILIIHF